MQSFKKLSVAGDWSEISFANINARLDNFSFSKNQPFTQCWHTLREMIVRDYFPVRYFHRNLVEPKLNQSNLLENCQNFRNLFEPKLNLMQPSRKLSLAGDRSKISFANINAKLDNSAFSNNQPFSQCWHTLREMIVMQITFVGFSRSKPFYVSKNMTGMKLTFQANASFEY